MNKFKNLFKKKISSSIYLKEYDRCMTKMTYVKAHTANVFC